jgi:hypothetical protein
MGEETCTVLRSGKDKWNYSDISSAVTLGTVAQIGDRSAIPLEDPYSNPISGSPSNLRHICFNGEALFKTTLARIASASRPRGYTWLVLPRQSDNQTMFSSTCANCLSHGMYCSFQEEK